MGATTVSDTYNALLTTTFRNMSKKMYDAITASNKLIYMLKKREGGYKRVSDLGFEKLIALNYENGSADSYSGYDELNVDPMDGITVSRWQWRQAAVPISISGREKRLNRGDSKTISLIQAKKQQAMNGIIEYVNKALLQGNGGTAIQTAKTSIVNGSTFCDPLPALVAYDPTAALTVGGIAQASNTWWQNQTFNSVSTTFAGFLKEMRRLYNLCQKGGGEGAEGAPNFTITDQSSFELYEAALAAAFRNTSYERADIPFSNVMFRGMPVTWDEFTPDIQGASATQSTTSGTMWMLNLDYWEFEVDKLTDFQLTDFITPENQDASTAQILWFGSVGIANRRKQGAMGGIDTTIAS